MLSSHLILSLASRKTDLSVTVDYSNAAGEQSVRTITSVDEPTQTDQGAWAVRAYDLDKKAWRRFSLERLEVLSLWQVDADGESRMVDPVKILAQAFSTRLESTLERVIGTNVFDSVMQAQLSDALDDARRIRRLMKEAV
jgi:predicted DNA-binding transcriptional regulator YafY